MKRNNAVIIKNNIIIIIIIHAVFNLMIFGIVIQCHVTYDINNHDTCHNFLYATIDVPGGFEKIRLYMQLSGIPNIL